MSIRLCAYFCCCLLRWNLIKSMWASYPAGTEHTIEEKGPVVFWGVCWLNVAWMTLNQTNWHKRPFIWHLDMTLDVHYIVTFTHQPTERRNIFGYFLFGNVSCFFLIFVAHITQHLHSNIFDCLWSYAWPYTVFGASFIFRLMIYPH